MDRAEEGSWHPHIRPRRRYLGTGHGDKGVSCPIVIHTVYLHTHTLSRVSVYRGTPFRNKDGVS